MPIVRDGIHTAAKVHYCDDCGRRIEIGSLYRRMFGNADDMSPLRELKLCSDCTDVDNDLTAKIIIRIHFSSDHTMLFGTSYKSWKLQVEEYMWRCNDGLLRPEKVDMSNSKWVAWGGLKWCPESDFQNQLNREGCQHNDADNLSPRQYSSMKFDQASTKIFERVIEFYEAGQRMLKINKLSKEEYERYQRGELKIV